MQIDLLQCFVMCTTYNISIVVAININCVIMAHILLCIRVRL